MVVITFVNTSYKTSHKNYMCVYLVSQENMKENPLDRNLDSGNINTRVLIMLCSFISAFHCMQTQELI